MNDNKSFGKKIKDHFRRNSDAYELAMGIAKFAGIVWMGATIVSQVKTISDLEAKISDLEGLDSPSL